MKIKMCQLLSSVKEALLMGKRGISSKIKYKMVKCMNNMRFFLNKLLQIFICHDRIINEF